MRIRVGILRGGPSHEYEVSLKSGATILKNISREKYEPIDIYIDKENNWHIDGVILKSYKALTRIDVIFNALHGDYGEDGQIQRILEHHSIPFTGSGSFASTLGMNKIISKELYKKVGIKTPYHIFLGENGFNDKTEDIALRIFKTFPMPAIVKPVSLGSSVGVILVLDFESLIKALEEVRKISNEIMVEEYIKGKETTCGVIEGFRGEEIYALPPIEIRPIGRVLFDYDAKYNGKSEEICPANFSQEIKDEIMKLSVLAHQSLGLNHYSRSDFMIHPKRGVYIIETNTLPGMTEESLIPKALKVIGSSVPDFIDHLLTLAINQKRR